MAISPAQISCRSRFIGGPPSTPSGAVGASSLVSSGALARGVPGGVGPRGAGSAMAATGPSAISLQDEDGPGREDDRNRR